MAQPLEVLPASGRLAGSLLFCGGFFGCPGHEALHLIESSKGIGCYIPHALISRLGLVRFVHAFSQSLGKSEFVARPAPPPPRHKKGQPQVNLVHYPFPGHTIQVI